MTIKKKCIYADKKERMKKEQPKYLLGVDSGVPI